MYQQAPFSRSAVLSSLFLRVTTHDWSINVKQCANKKWCNFPGTNYEFDGEERLCVNVYETIPQFKRTSSPGKSYGINTRDGLSEGIVKPGLSLGVPVSYGKQTSEEEYRLEDVEAELESLRED